jgi:hypothetical protein
MSACPIDGNISEVLGAWFAKHKNLSQFLTSDEQNGEMNEPNKYFRERDR